MKKGVFVVLGLLIIIIFASCQTISLPDPGGSGGGDDPQPIGSDDDIVFIHHSCGENWLDNSLNAALLSKNYIDERNDITYGTTLQPDTGRPDSLWGTPGDNTDMNHWIRWFNDYMEGAKAYGAADGENRIIMFKSCYPNSAVGSVGTVPGDPFSDTRTAENYKAVFTYPAGVSTYRFDGHDYEPLDVIFAANADTLFIFVTAPPLCWNDGDSEDGQRVRDFNEWIMGEWLTAYNNTNPGLNNVAVFDWFDFLAYDEGAAAHANLLKDAYGGNSGDSHPNATANSQSTTHFVSGVANLLDPIWQLFSN